MQYQETEKLIYWPRKGLIESLLTKLLAGIPFVVGKEVIRSHLRQEHLNTWETCKGCCQSKTLMSDLLPRKTKELQAMSRQQLAVAVGLLTGHTTLMFKLRLTWRRDCRLCGDEKEDTLHILYVIVWH
jgi:hypothetical protein